MHFSTQSIHTGQSPDPQTGAVISPIYATSTFEYGNPEGFDYTRSGNPNFRRLDQTLAALDQAEFATVFGSGVTAITAIVSTLKSGDLVIAEENIYGCTIRLFRDIFEKFGVNIKYIDLTKPESEKVILEQKPQLLWLESPTNPLLKILNIPRLCEVAHRAGSQVVMDNTFASPYLQTPLNHGVDINFTSATKYHNGHSNAMLGVVTTNHDDWQEKMIFAQKALGLQPSPFDAWIVSQGVKTLELRMERHCKNALDIAQWLEMLPEVERVIYPFLLSHPQYELAKNQMKAGGGIVTVKLDKNRESIEKFLAKLKLFPKAESLGGVESLVCHPASMTHASVPRAQREAVGLSDNLVRFSIGIEHIDDLKKDIQQALDSV